MNFQEYKYFILPIVIILIIGCTTDPEKDIRNLILDPSASNSYMKKDLFHRAKVINLDTHENAFFHRARKILLLEQYYVVLTFQGVLVIFDTNGKFVLKTNPTTRGDSGLPDMVINITINKFNSTLNLLSVKGHIASYDIKKNEFNPIANLSSVLASAREFEFLSDDLICFQSSYDENMQLFTFSLKENKVQEVLLPYAGSRGVGYPISVFSYLNDTLNYLSAMSEEVYTISKSFNLKKKILYNGDVNSIEQVMVPNFDIDPARVYEENIVHPFWLYWESIGLISFKYKDENVVLIQSEEDQFFKWDMPSNYNSITPFINMQREHSMFGLITDLDYLKKERSKFASCINCDKLVEENANYAIIHYEF